MTTDQLSLATPPAGEPFAFIPSEMKGVGKWFIDAGSKMPHSTADSGMYRDPRWLARGLYVARWSNHDERLTWQEVERICKHYAGRLWPEFEFSGDDDIVCLDLDNAIDEHGRIKPWALAIVNRFPGYWEVSKRGRGLHGFFVCQANPLGDRRKIKASVGDGSAEVFSTTGLVVLTGRMLAGCESRLVDHTDAMRQWVAEIAPERPTPVDRPARQTDRSRDAYASGGATPLDRCRNYVAKLPPSIQGEGGSKAAMRVACECARFGLSLLEARMVFDEFNQRCEPPWSGKEIEHKLDDGFSAVERSGEFGRRLDTDWPPRHSGGDGAAAAACPTFSQERDGLYEKVGHEADADAETPLSLGLPASWFLRPEPPCPRPRRGLFSHVHKPKLMYGFHRCGRRGCEECQDAKLARWANEMTVDVDDGHPAIMTGYRVCVGKEPDLDENGNQKLTEAGNPKFKNLYEWKPYEADQAYFAGEIDASDLPTVTKAVSRGKGNYISIAGESKTTVVATSEFSGSRKIDRAEALELAHARILATPKPPAEHEGNWRPITTSDGWKKRKEKNWKLEGRPAGNVSTAQVVEAFENQQVKPKFVRDDSTTEGIRLVAEITPSFDLERFKAETNIVAASRLDLAEMLSIEAVAACEPRPTNADRWEAYYERFPHERPGAAPACAS